MYGQPVKFIGGRASGDGGTHKPSGQWMTVLYPRSSILLDGHEDSDEATDTFRRVRKLVLPMLRISQPCVREAYLGQDGTLDASSRKV